MTSPSIVRTATPDDESEIWRLFRMLHAENAMLPISERKVQNYIDRMLHPESISLEDLGPRGIIGVIGEVGSLEGAIMLAFGSAWYSEVITLDEFLNFIDPAHRNSNHAKALIGYAKHIVDQVRLTHAEVKLVIGVLSTKRTAAKVRFYERQLTPAGSFFIYPTPDNIDASDKRYRTQ